MNVLWVEFDVCKRRERLPEEREKLLGQGRFLSRFAPDRVTPALNVAIVLARSKLDRVRLPAHRCQ